MNYRRLLEDRHWPPTTDLADVTRFIARPLCVAAHAQGELIVGAAGGLAESLDQRDPTWLNQWKAGLIHLVYPEKINPLWGTYWLVDNSFRQPGHDGRETIAEHGNSG